MRFFVYDVETSGIDLTFDQILSLYGVMTDEGLLQQYRLSNGRLALLMRRRRHILPSPMALLVNRLDPRRLDDPRQTISGYALAHRLRDMIWRHSREPLLISGYNSHRFDAQFLRQLFHQALLSPLEAERSSDPMSDTLNRIDFIRMSRAAVFLYPHKIRSGTNASGKASFRLTDMAAANGIAVDLAAAHGADYDVEGLTLPLARLLQAKTPDLWPVLLNNAWPNQVAGQILPRRTDQNLALFAHTSLSRNAPDFAPIAFAGQRVTTYQRRDGRSASYTNKAVVLMADLRQDPALLMGLNEAGLVTEINLALRGQSGLLRAIRTKEQPLLIPLPWPRVGATTPAARDALALADRALAQLGGGRDLALWHARARTLRDPLFQAGMTMAMNQALAEPAGGGRELLPPELRLFDHFGAEPAMQDAVARAVGDFHRADSWPERVRFLRQRVLIGTPQRQLMLMLLGEEAYDRLNPLEQFEYDLFVADRLWRGPRADLPPDSHLPNRHLASVRTEIADLLAMAERTDAERSLLGRMSSWLLAIEQDALRRLRLSHAAALGFQPGGAAALLARTAPAVTGLLAPTRRRSRAPTAKPD